MTLNHVFANVLVVALALLASAASAVDITGAGATFPYPIYAKWAEAYKAKTGVGMNYQSIGSGGGIKQIQNKTVDFGASDMPLKPEDLDKDGLLQFPTVIGGDVPVVNLEGVTAGQLKLTGPVLADIYLGKIVKWNDPAIVKLNPTLKLPDSEITVVHRSDGSGTTFIWVNYLSKVSPEWKQKVGEGTAVAWPTGVGGKGNEGVTGQVKQQPNTIGYVELAYAVQNKLPVAIIKNASGNFVEPSIDAVTAAAAASAGTTPEDLRVSITNASGADAYPISSYTYILAYKDQKDANKGKALVDFLWWGIHDGESFAKDLLYAPLPAEIAKRVEGKINSITSGGKPLK